MRLALGVEYLGTDFCGWQRQQAGIRTVQQVVEEVLSVVANHPVRVFCAGRTDAGVHAIEQVIHFQSNAKRTPKTWLLGGNAGLPEDVNFVWVKVVADDFHARFDAHAREYQYKIFNHPIRSSLKAPFTLWESSVLDVDLMQEAAQHLLGKHDFSSFRSSLCSAKSPIKTIEYIRFNQQQQNISITIKANAFLHNMVRNIVGTLLKVGRGKQPAVWVKTVLDAKDRKTAGVTARPNGLYFVKAFYADF